MDFQQVKYTRFIGPTSCYSGLRRLSEDGDGFMTTESDSFRFSAQQQHESFGYPLPKQASNEIPCVGHDWCDDQRVFVLLHKNSMDDDFSFWNHMNASMLTMDVPPSVTSSSQQRRRPSVSDASVVSEAITTTSATIPMAVEEEETRHTSHLIWNNGGTSCGSASLPCRLLSPTFSKMSDGSYLVWTGCADDSELRCFQLINKTYVRSVSLKALDTFTSPIMSVEATCENDGETNDENGRTTLALGCQDGTVRLLTFSCRIVEDQEVELSDIHSHTVIVDGPILSLHLAGDRVLVGSMCGYVCQLQLQRRGESISSTSSMSSGENNHMEHPQWEEPQMVVKDFLLDARYGAEDPVLAVHYWKNRVILGTYSGLVQVYVTTTSTAPTSVDCGNDTVVINNDKKNEHKATYAVEWSVRLPYPVHAIAHFGDQQLVVTTKRSLHVFESKATSTYSAVRAKARLEKIMKRQQNRP
jgi:hypothetical protein